MYRYFGLTEKVGMTLFLLAIYEKRLQLVQMILDSTMDRKRILSQKDIYGNGAIHLAVLSDSLDILKLLCKQGIAKDLTNDVWSL